MSILKSEFRIETIKDFLEFMQKAITAGIEKAVDEEFEVARKRIESRRAEIITGTILSIQKQVNWERAGDNLVITIRDKQNEN